MRLKPGLGEHHADAKLKHDGQVANCGGGAFD
jgi:hypothetical protein